ncbi:hypothetical protein D3C72_1912340 [compost metagenome]
MLLTQLAQQGAAGVGVAGLAVSLVASHQLIPVVGDRPPGRARLAHLVPHGQDLGRQLHQAVAAAEVAVVIRHVEAEPAVGVGDPEHGAGQCLG